MIILERKHYGMKITEFRYPEMLIEGKTSQTKIYSFKDLKINANWVKRKVCAMQFDLLKSEEELFNGITKRYRQQIRREEKDGIKVFQTKVDEKFEEYYKKIYIPLFKKKKLKPFPLEYLKQGTLWYAEKDGKMLSGAVFFVDEVYASQAFTASNHERYNGHRLLIWETIKYYKRQGCRRFNFGGGESDYKRGFGSEKFDIWTYQKYKNPLFKIMRNVVG